MSGVRVVLADDDVLLREGLASLLERAGYEIVGQADGPDALLELVTERQPELAVIDIRMAPTYTLEGLEAATAIRAEFPQVGILLLSAHVDVETAMDLVRSGEGVGYLLKSRVRDVDDFLDAIERVARRGSVVDPALVEELVSARRRSDPLAELTDKEREVLALMAEGRSNGGIAQQLWVTEGAVEKNVKSILAKLNLPVSGTDNRRVLAVLTFLDAN